MSASIRSTNSRGISDAGTGLHQGGRPSGPSPENHSPVEVRIVDRPHRQSGAGEKRGRPGGLPFTCLYEHPTALGDPFPGLGSNPAVDVESVGSSVEGCQGFMKARLRRHRPDRLCGDIRGVHREHLDPSFQARRKGAEKVALVDVASQGRQVPPGTADCGRIDIGSMYLKARELAGQNNPNGPGTTAKVNHDVPREDAAGGSSRVGTHLGGAGRRGTCPGGTAAGGSIWDGAASR